MTWEALQREVLEEFVEVGRFGENAFANMSTWVARRVEAHAVRSRRHYDQNKEKCAARSAEWSRRNRKLINARRREARAK